MVYGGYKYIDYDYEVDTRSDIVVLHWVEGRKDIETLAEALAAESSVGTWTKLETVNMDVFERYRARVFRINAVGKTKGFVWLAYPLEHFDIENLPQILASIRGNVYGLSELEALKFLDIYLPPKLQRHFKGPKFGIDGMRKRLETYGNGRPHIGTIVKPKVGLSPKEWANVAYDAYKGGCDFVKDDENLVNQAFCRWQERVDEMMKVIDRIEKEEGRRVLYSPNITDRYSRMLDRIDYLKDIGWDMAMIDVYIMGYSALIDIVEELHKANIRIHAHRAGHTAETRGRFGCEYPVFAKLWRLIGVDQLHTGTGLGKMEGGPVLIRRYAEIVRCQEIDEALHLLSLNQKWNDDIKPLMPVASGGLNATLVPGLMEIYGRDFVVQAGGGIHGHPQGTRAGAKSMVQAVEAVMTSTSLMEKASNSKELATAIEKWGMGVDPNEVRARIKMVEENADSYRDLIFREGYRAFEILSRL